MASALSISRMALASARAFPARRGALQAAAGGGRGAFGAGVPPSRMLGERRLFAFPANGNGGRGAHTSTSALPKDRNSIKAPAAASAAKAKQAEQPTELTFAPFDEVKKPLEELREAEGHDVSLAREEGYTSQLEEAINQQINVELTISHIYHSMYAYFDRDNVALRGMAKYFHKVSNDEREHAQSLMDYQNRRGGRVMLQTIPAPLSEFNHTEKGDALNAMELALSLEKLNYQKLKNLDKLAVDAEDFNLADYVDKLLDDQTEDVKRAADYVSQLRRVGKGHGTWAWDQQLYEDYE